MGRQKFQPPKGTRDFLPEEMNLRRSVIEKLRDVFISFGYGELDTPAFEYFETLARKSGHEVGQEIYVFEDKGGRKLGLVFEFTASLARLVASDSSLLLPFKRYAIGKVWRYESPQSGRYREFYQADVDIVGSYSMDCETEILCLTIAAFQSLGLNDYRIHLNNRKILEAQAAEAGIPQGAVPNALRALDKLPKIGEVGVREEFLQRGLRQSDCDRFFSLIATEGDNREMLRQSEKALYGNHQGLRGVEEIGKILDYGDKLGFGDRLVIDPLLVRGLDYYTGPIFEVKEAAAPGGGSLAGGGRYDDLIGLFGGRPTGAVGISFGVDRIIDRLSTRDMPVSPGCLVFVAHISTDVKHHAMKIAHELRRARIPTEIELSERKIGRQLSYAHRKGIPYVLVVGPDEVKRSSYQLKTMKTGSEQTLPLPEIVEVLSKALEAGSQCDVGGGE